jgi:8-hydroxy-5-deazaflavin:NADPH oxidoreductase
MTTWEPADLAELAGLTLGILGGTGDQGRGLGRRFAAAGVNAILGSREASRAEEAARALPGPVRGADNASCARDASVVVVAVPWAGHEALLRELAEELAGKTVVDCVNPLGFDNQGAFVLDVAEGSACQQAVALLPGSTVVGAFHHLSAVQLLDSDLETIEGDVLVVGDDRAATDLVQALAGLIPGMRGVYAGRLRNARQVEALTANLISVNRRYKAHAGIRVTDI